MTTAMRRPGGDTDAAPLGATREPARVVAPGSAAEAVGWRWHVLAVVVMTSAAPLTMRGWLDGDRLPGGDTPGYVAMVAYVRDALLRWGRVPVWCPKWFAGSTQFMSVLKELATAPLALWLGPLRGTQVMFVVAVIAAGIAMYALVVRLLRAPAAGMIAGYAYAFGTPANSEVALGGHLDVALSMALFPAIFLAAAEMLRTRRIGWGIGLGALIAAQLAVHYVQLVSCALVIVVLLALRPWRGSDDHTDTHRRGLIASAAVALATFLLLAGSQLVWLAVDARNHLLNHPEQVAQGWRVFIEQSPFMYVNRSDWLGSWIAAHRPPDLLWASDDPLFNARRYLGLVALAVSAGGWLAAGRRPALRRWYQTFALVFLLQYWLSMGPATLEWQLARALHWPESVDRPIDLALTLASLGCIGWAAVLVVRRQPIARVEAALTVGLLCFVASHSLFDLARRVVPMLDGLRSPGHLFDLAPCAFYATFAVAATAILYPTDRPRCRLAFAFALAVLVMLDFWPSTRAFHVGTPMAPVRAAEEVIARLPAEDGTLRLAMDPASGEDPVVSLIAMSGDVGAVRSWINWQAGTHWAPYEVGTLWSVSRALTAEQRRQAHSLSAVLCRIARIRYLLDRPDGSDLVVGEPWTLRATTPPYAVWESPDVMPMAYGYRSYLVVLGGADSLWTVEAAFARNVAVVSGGDRLAESPPDLIEGADAVGYVEPAALGDQASAALAHRHAGKILRLDDPEQALARRSAASEPLVPVQYRRPVPEHIELEVDAGSAPAVVFVSESHHPWWQATVDSRPAPVLRADVAFMAVRVGPGAHVIDLRLRRPLLVAVADRVSTGAWALLPFVAVAWAFARRKGPS